VRISVHSRPRRVRAAVSVTVALAAGTLAVAFGGTPASATETSPSPSASVSPPTTEQEVESPTAPAEQPQFEQKPSAQIDGIVWDDENRNGIRDADESPLADAAVLIEPITDGELPQKTKLDALTKARGMQRGLILRNEAYLGVRTGADGRYKFENLPSVPVRLWVVGPKTGNDAVWRVSRKGEGTDRALDSDFTEVTVDLPGLPGGGPLYVGKSDRQQLQEEQRLTLDAGLHLRKHAGSISGRVWNDRNRNGVQDRGEKGVDGLPVVALAQRGPKLSNGFNSARARLAAAPGFHLTTTDAKGEYSFPEVMPGEWVVAVGAGPLSPDQQDIPVIVWTFTQKDAGGDDAKDSDVLLSEKFQNKAAVSDILVIERDGKADVDAGVFRDEPSPNPSASATAEPSTSNSPSAAPAPGTAGGSLPKTGLAIGGFLLAGAVLIGGGTALTLAARKRRTTL